MRKISFNHVHIWTMVFLFGWNLVSIDSTAQQLNIRDFAIFSGSGDTGTITGTTTPPFPGYGVQIGSSITINGGSIGSYKLVQSTGNATLNSNIYSGGKITLTNSNVVGGKITAANSGSLPGTILSIGSSASLSGNIDVNGNIVIGGGTVSGIVTHPPGTTYSGPEIGERNKTGIPALPTLPGLPALSSISLETGPDIKSSDEIAPGTYGNVTLSGNKTLKLQGPGIYIFNSIHFSGNSNKFVFDFLDATSGNFYIYIRGDADFGKLNASVANGGGASRIYTEVHGKGTTSSISGYSFIIANGSAGGGSKWLGTVWAPYAGINIGAGTGSSSLAGTLYSATQVNIQSGVTFTYNPLVEDNDVIIPFNPNKGKVSTLIGSELTSLTESISDEAKKVLVILDDNVLIDVIAKVGHEAEVQTFLLSQGMSGVISNGTNTLITTGKFPIANLLNLNNRGDIINFCRPVFVPIGNSGLIKNAGDTAIGSHLVRNGYNLQGLGVKIGVLSDSYNTQVTSSSNPAELDIATGELPGVGNPVNSTPVQVLLDYPYFPRSDEGRAMLQIVHDLAPKAELAFRTGFISPGDFAVGIKQMQEANCQVIVDDITFINEPFLQDGPVAKAVDQVKSLGVTYFTSAGNFSNRSHEQNYRPVAAPAGFPTGTTAHDFSGSGDILQRIKLKPGSYTIVLQWEDDIYSIGQTQAGGTKNDFDLYLTDLSGNIICGYNRDNTNGDPFEFLAYTVTNSVTEVDANILITRANVGTTTPRFKYIIFRGDAVISEYQTGNSTIVGQANAAGAITVGAINYFKTPAFTSAAPAIAPYSSVGGTLIGGGNRNKPDIAAPDGVNTSVNMGPDYSGDSDPFSNFFGTSAAAPHAAATAALLIEGRKRFLDEVLSPDGVKNLMQSTALNIGAANAAGAGLIQADLAMRSFASPTPFLISLEYPSTITPTSLPASPFTLTVTGDYLSDESQVLFRGVPVTTTFVSTTELTAIIPAFSTGNPPIQVFTPPLANGDGGYSNTVLFFSIPKKTIKVTADSKTKKYGEQLPSFTSSILVNNVPLAQSGLTLQDIGLESLSYSTNATTLSNIGNQYFIKPVRTFDLTNATDVGLLESYIYDTIPGILTITKLPVTVIPNDQTITYGEDIAPITFRYEIDPAIATTTPQVVNIIKLSHEEFLAEDVVGLVNKLPVAISNGFPVAISNGFPIAISNGFPVAISNGEEIPLYNAQSVTGFDIGVATVVPYTFTQQELANLSFYASEKSLLNPRELTTNTKVIDIAQQSVLGYNSNPSLTTMVNTIEPLKAKGILGAEPLSNGSLPVAISNKLPVAISNAFPVAISNGGLPVVISNGFPVAISNGAFPIAISNSFAEQAPRIAVIIDQTDVSEQTGIVLRALNTITGITSGEHSIIPGSVLNDNYQITYGLGKLTVRPATITVKANDITRPYGTPNPTLTAGYTGFKYGENFETSDIEGAAAVTTTAVEASPVGIYDINAATGTLSSFSYIFNFQKGKLTIENNPCLLTRDPFTNFGSTSNPGTATSLWLNIETKVSGQLSTNGDYLLFSFGTVTFNNITSTPTITNTPIPAGKIIADNTVSAPITSYDAATNTWITKVPVGFSSTSDIFITGVILNSSKGFAKKHNANSVVKGIFYSNTSFTDQWTYGIAAYQPQFTYSSIAGAGQVTSINGNFRAGTPVTQINNLVNGGSGGGGNNYSGSTSSFDKFTACLAASSTLARSSNQNADKYNVNAETVEDNLAIKESLNVIPNPAGNYTEIVFRPSVSGNVQLNLFSLSGVKVADVLNGQFDAGKMYQRRLNVSNLAAGIYFIQLENGGKREIKKLVIAR